MHERPMMQEAKSTVARNLESRAKVAALQPGTWSDTSGQGGVGAGEGDTQPAAAKGVSGGNVRRVSAQLCILFHVSSSKPIKSPFST